MEPLVNTSLTANGSTASYKIPKNRSGDGRTETTVTIQFIAGSGTVAHQASTDGTNWFTITDGIVSASHTASVQYEHSPVGGDAVEYRFTLSGSSTPNIAVIVERR